MAQPPPSDFDPLGDMYAGAAEQPPEASEPERASAAAPVSGDEAQPPPEAIAAVSPVSTADAIGHAEAQARAGEQPPVRVISGNPEGYRPGDEVVIAGVPAAYNYTYGPIYIYEGPRSIDAIYHMREPVVVFADMIPIDELQRLELTHIRGFVFERGSAADEDEYNFLNNENRAAVIGCTGALFFAEHSRDRWVIVDGVAGAVCFCPRAETLERFEAIRAEGPPPRSRELALSAHFKHMLDAKLEERARKEAAGERLKHPHDLGPKEALAVQQEGPGLVLQLLSGLPVPELLEWERKQKEKGIEF